MTKNKTIQLLFAAALSCTAVNASTIFNFDTDSLGTSTQFTDTVNGTSATFSGNADPGGFIVFASMFQTLTGNVLVDLSPVGPLSIGFSRDISAVALSFATADFTTASPFTLTAYENATLVGSASAAGIVPAGFTFPEGSVAFTASRFNRLVLSSTAPNFAVDNINVTPAAAPEPAVSATLGAGLIAIGLLLRRRKAVKQNHSSRPSLIKTAAFTCLSLSATLASAQSTHSIFPLLPPVVSTVPSNGDVNPYGVAFAPKTVPAGAVLQPGDILVSNFNNSANLQGTGKTIVRVDKYGTVTTFYTSPNSGLTAALGILSNGWIIIGNLPTVDGTSATVQPGRITILNASGLALGTIGSAATVNGPWGMAVHDNGNGVSGVANIFVSNVLSGVISRFDITYNGQGTNTREIVLSTGFSHRLDPAALVLGPSGLVYDVIHDTLLVASSADNAVYEIPMASVAQGGATATLLFRDPIHLHGPLDLAILPNGHLLIANSDGSNVDTAQPSELVEYTAVGQFMGQMSIDPANGGAFGLATSIMSWGTFRLAAVDDNANTLKIWTAVAQ